MNKFLIYYAINNSNKYLEYVFNSISSLKKIENYDIKVFIYGNINYSILNIFKNVDIIVKEEEIANNYTSLKWFALQDFQNIDTPTIIFADADTYFFDSPENILSRCSDCNFYAREELATTKGEYLFHLGSKQLKPTINHEILDIAYKVFNSKETPIFNTGFMIFNDFLWKRIAEKIDFYKIILQSFINQKITYPSSKIHLIDEIVSSIILGKIDGLSYQKLDKNLFPLYPEYKEGEVSSFGLLTHIISEYYDDFTKELKRLNYVS